MHPLAYEHLKKVLISGLVGPDESCDYYPCHFRGQDCTWCFCPFYPCKDQQTGGEWLKRKDGTSVWNCTHCYWIHRFEVASVLLEIIRGRGIKRVEDLERVRVSIFHELKDSYPPVKGQ